MEFLLEEHAIVMPGFVPTILYKWQRRVVRQTFYLRCLLIFMEFVQQ